MYPSVKEVHARDGHVLFIVFENGECGTLDLSQVLGFGVFKRISDPNEFSKVRVGFDTVEWECGVDLDPEYVYSRCSFSDPRHSQEDPRESGSHGQR
jgi:hypothetical protein